MFPKKNPTAQARGFSRDTTKIAVSHRQRKNPSNEGAWLSRGRDANVLGIPERNGVLSYLLHRAVYGGAQSELLALRWSYLDRGAISINRALHNLVGKHFVFQSLKTAKSRKHVPLSSSTSILLRRQRDDQRSVQLFFDHVAAENDLVFWQIVGVHYFLTRFTGLETVSQTGWLPWYSSP